MTRNSYYDPNGNLYDMIIFPLIDGDGKVKWKADLEKYSIGKIEVDRWGRVINSWMRRHHEYMEDIERLDTDYDR